MWIYRYDRVPTVALHEGSQSGVEVTDGFKVGVRLLQGLALCLFLFAVVIDRTMFADNIELCREGGVKVEAMLEREE